MAQQAVEKIDLQWAAARSEKEMVLALVHWSQVAAVLTVAEVEANLNLNLHFARGAGQENLEEVEAQESEDVGHSEGADKVDHTVAGHNRVETQVGHNHLRDLALQLWDRDEVEARRHNRADVQHQDEDRRQGAEVAWCMVKSRP